MQKSIQFFSIALIIATAFGCGQRQDDPSAASGTDQTQKSDTRALKIAQQVSKALGGQSNWENARYLSFRWVVEQGGKDVADYRHDWDRAGNRYRVEGTRRDGKHFVVTFNTATKQGSARLDGEQVPEDSTLTKLIDYAYGRYINDSYWFIMPFKLKDPGVTLADAGEAELNGVTCDVLKMTFENVGLTAGDTYWIYVDQQEHLVRKWEYHLQGWDADRERGGSTWEDWRNVGGVNVAMNKQFLSGKGRIYFKDVFVEYTPDETTFANMSRTFGENMGKN